jgi:hypothetical protein
MSVKVVLAFLGVLAITYAIMGFRASTALERAVCDGRPEVFVPAPAGTKRLRNACNILRDTDATVALQVAWWTWPWNLGKSPQDLRESFVAHFVKQ